MICLNRDWLASSSEVAERIDRTAVAREYNFALCWKARYVLVEAYRHGQHELILVLQIGFNLTRVMRLAKALFYGDVVLSNVAVQLHFSW